MAECQRVAGGGVEALNVLRPTRLLMTTAALDAIQASKPKPRRKRKAVAKAASTLATSACGSLNPPDD